jgi:hypothetical protein
MKKLHFCSIAPIGLLLATAGCGGGNTDNSAAVDAATYVVVEATPVPLASLAIGTGHPDFTAEYGKATITFPAGAPALGVTGLAASYPSYTGTYDYADTSHIPSIVPTLAWAKGWDGYGQSISVIDDFHEGGISYSKSFSTERQLTLVKEDYNLATRTIEFNTYVGTYKVPYSASLPTTHGAIVSNIAGGDELGSLVDSTIAATPGASTLTACSLNGVVVAKDRCTAVTGSAIDLAWSAASAQVSYRKAAGIAKAAVVIEHHVDLSASQNAFTTPAFLVGDMENSFRTAAINLSLGTDVATAGITMAKVIEDIRANNKLIRKSEAVVAVAAGNSYGPCGEMDLAGCNYLAAYYALAPQTRESVLVVGATTGSGENERLALYSTRAGALASRFILASGDTAEPDVKGTSFAAPRIAGAIALVRQKYPKLTAAEAANLLLLTANKDINNDGIADFAGVSQIYGHGKLDLARALSPLGSAAVGP